MNQLIMDSILKTSSSKQIQNKLELNELVEKISKLETVAITSHISPDADAIGSSGALAIGLASLGKKVVHYLEEPISKKFLPLIETLQTVAVIPADKFDGVIIVDTATKKRIGKENEKFCMLAEEVINIDHHISNDLWGTANYINSDSASSSEIVYEILEQLQVNITKEIANLLLAGLIDDTGSFRFSNTNQRSFLIASKLLSHGASPHHVSQILYASLPRRVIDLKAAVVKDVQFLFEERVAIVNVTQELLNSFQAGPDDTEGLLDEIRNISTVEVAILLRELQDRRSWKASVRSKIAQFDANIFCSHFGGGGHKAASGCTISGSSSSVQARVVEQLKKFYT
jgi:phosphoesterase RecJ-like protein